MPCVTVGKWIVNMGAPSQMVTMQNGRVLELEWHDYFGPGVVDKRRTAVKS